MQVSLCRFSSADSNERRILLTDPSYEPDCADSIVQSDHADFGVQILLCVFLHTHSIVSIKRFLSKASYRAYADFILRILSCGFHCADSIVRRSLCGFYRADYRADFMVRIIVQIRGFHCADSIVKIVVRTSLCGFHIAVGINGDASTQRH